MCSTNRGQGGPLAVGDSADSAAHKPQFPFPCTLLVSPLPSHEIHELGDEIAMSFGPAPSVCYPSVTGFQTFSSTSVRSPQKSHRLGFTDERALHYAPAFIDRYCGVANEGRKKKKNSGRVAPNGLYRSHAGPAVREGRYLLMYLTYCLYVFHVP